MSNRTFWKVNEGRNPLRKHTLKSKSLKAEGDQGEPMTTFCLNKTSHLQRDYDLEFDLAGLRVQVTSLG